MTGQPMAALSYEKRLYEKTGGNCLEKKLTGYDYQYRAPGVPDISCSAGSGHSGCVQRISNGASDRFLHHDDLSAD